jgi:hypothetical protein
MSVTDAKGGWSREVVARGVVIACVALGVGGALGWLVAHEPAPRETPRAPAGDAELALVAPLRVGAALGTYRVDAIDAVVGGALRVTCSRGTSVVRLDVALRSDAGPEAPATAGPFAVFYSSPDGDAPAAEALAKALAGVIGKNAEAAPPGLAPFAPDPR